MTRPCRSRVLLPAAFVLAGACSDIPDVTVPSGLTGLPRAMATVVDGANGGNPNFFFLPPIAPRERSTGPLDASLEPVVEVCRWSENACVGPAVSRLDARVHGNHYAANWQTRGLGLDPAVAYRLRVLVAGTELGSVDVDVMRPDGGKKKRAAAGAIALVEGQTLPVKFRIQRGAVTVVGAEGGQVSSADGLVQVDIPAGALSGDVGITMYPTTGAPPAGGFVVGGAMYELGPHGVTFDAPVQLTIAYDEANLPAGREEHELRLLHFTGGRWEGVAGSTVNTEANTVTGGVTSFSPFAPGGGNVITLSAYGTALVDGLVHPTEWANAACANFQANLSGGGQVPASVCVMNDATNLYFSVSYFYTLMPSGDASLNVIFDNTDDGLTSGDDGFITQYVFAGGSIFAADLYLHSGGTCSTALCQDPDVSAASGTQDGTGMFLANIGPNGHEFSKPLDSFDNAHDFSLSVGSLLGFTLSLAINGFSNSTQFPAPIDHGHIVIAAQPDSVDQRQSIVDDSVGGLAIGHGSEQMLAQTVTAGRSGVLWGVSFPMSCESGALIVEIQGVGTGGVPNGVVLASETLPSVALPFIAPGTMMRTVRFTTPPTMAVGDKFAVILKNPTGGCGVFQGPVGNPYAGGQAFFDARPNPVGVWEPLGARNDLAFETIVK